MITREGFKKLILLLVTGMVLIFLLVWLYGYFHAGQVIISTNGANNSITLTASDNGRLKNGAQTYKAKGKLSKKVHTGQYVVAVEGNSTATYQVITLKSRQILSITINPINPSVVEPVAFENAQNLVADNNQLEFLNESHNTLNKIDSQNNLSVLSSPPQLQTIKWADTNFGITQGGSGNLFTVRNGVVAPMQVPFAPGNSTGYAVSPSKRIYVSDGANIYMGGPSGGLSKIYKAGSSRPLLAAGKNDLAVISPAPARHDSQNAQVTILNNSGKIISQKHIDSAAIIWSPDDKYLASLSQGGGAVIYTAFLKEVATIPATNVNLVSSLTWLSDNSILFPIASQLWVYDLTTQRSQLLASMPLDAFINSMAINPDKSYVYLTTVDSGGNTAIVRVGLKGQEVPLMLSQLRDVLPINRPGYDIGLINFAGAPTIQAIQYPGGPANAQQVDAQLLQEYGFDLSKLRFHVVQSD